MNCNSCNNVLEEAQPKITLLCEHVYHTRCFLVNSARDNIGEFSCNVCDAQIITPEIYEEANPPTTTVECDNLAESSEEFRTGINNIVAKYKGLMKTQKQMNAKIKTIVQEYKTYVKPQILMLKNYIKSRKKLIKELDEYKATRKELTSFKSSVTRFCGTHNINEYDLRRYLRRTKYILMNRSRFYRLEYMLHRNFRIHI